MRVPRIHTHQPLACGTFIELEPQASHHLSKVLRMQQGDPLILFNGDGHDYAARIETVHKRYLQVEVGEATALNTESPLSIHLGIGVSKGDRMDWIMQKATELGVAAITPLFTGRTEVKLKGERLDKKLQHWQQIMISACEQSGRSKVPELHIPDSADTWMNKVEAERKFVLHHRCKDRPKAEDRPGSIALLVGPEGGLSELEISAAQQQQFQPLALGPRVLRTETAPLAAISVLQFLWGDF